MGAHNAHEAAVDQLLEQSPHEAVDLVTDGPHLLDRTPEGSGRSQVR